MTSYKDYLVLEKANPTSFKDYNAAPFYNIFLLKGKGLVSIDFIDFEFDGKIALFSTPYQQVKTNGRHRRRH